MKKLLTTTFISTLGLFIFLSQLFIQECSMAQPITVTLSQFQTILTPGQSDYYFHSDSTVTKVNLGKRGGPNIYDFTGISFEPKQILHNYRISDIPILAARYPASAIVFGNSPDSIEQNPVLLFGNDTLFVVGNASLVPRYRFKHNQPYEITAVFPATYGNPSYNFTTTVFDTTYSSQWKIDSVQIYSGSDTVTVDGYGTLKIPGYQFQCLRVRTDHSYGGSHDKDIFFLTREGAFVDVFVTSGQPDTGLVQIQDMFVILAGTLVGVNERPVAPTSFSLSQNYPNPFNPSTTISYSVPGTSHVTINVYDALGRMVATLVNEEKMAGSYQVVFDASRLPSGIYFYRLSSGNYSSVRKLALVK